MLLYATGVVVGVSELLVLGVGALVLPALAWISVGRPARLDVTRRTTPAHITQDEHVDVELTVHNHGRRTVHSLLVEETVANTGRPLRFEVGRVAPGGQVVLSYRLGGLPRGRLALGPVATRRSDPFGLACDGQQLGTVDRIMVRPRQQALPGGRDTAGFGGQRRTGGWAPPATTHEPGPMRVYQDGDDLRRVNWRVSARHGTLMVRQEEPTRQTRALLVLGHGTVGEGRQDAFELAVTAAASIGVHLLRAGYQVACVTCAGQVQVSGQDTDRLLDLLAQVEYGGEAAPLDRTGSTAGAELVVAVLAPPGTGDAASLRRLTGRGLTRIALGTLEPDTEAHPALDELAEHGWRTATLTSTDDLSSTWTTLLSRQGQRTGSAP